jgi:small subunit ribosomal protein S9
MPAPKKNNRTYRPHGETPQPQEEIFSLVEEEVEVLASSDKRILKTGEYIATIGRRKTSTAQVRMSTGTGKHTNVIVNGKPLDQYFKTPELQKTVRQPFQKIKYSDIFDITAIVVGGGQSGQAQAVRHGIARGLIEYDIATRPQLKKFGYLKRDPRSKERKKPGLKKARKASQWSKR